MNEAAKVNPAKGDNKAATDSPRRYERSSINKILPTDRISFEKQIEILRGFAAVYASNSGKPVTPEKAGEVLTPQFSGTTVSQSVAFFADVGLLVRSEKGGFMPSQALTDYNTTLQWDQAEARSKLRPIFEQQWFFRCLAPRLQLAPQPESTCLASLAAEAKAESRHQKQLQYILSFLELANVISRDGGRIALLQSKSGGRENHIEQQPAPRADSTISLSSRSETGNGSIGNHQEKAIHTSTLPLDKEQKRVVTITAPLDVTEKEVNRIKQWIALTLLIDGSTEEEKT